MTKASPGSVLVTGAGGMIGSNIAAACRDRGWSVIGTYRRTPISLEGCATVPLLLDDELSVGDAIAAWRVGTIVHCAASVELGVLETDASMVAANIRATAATIAAAGRAQCRYVLVSSDWVFAGTIPAGNCYSEEDARGPVNAYGRSKAASEEIVETSSTEWLITRPANVYGVNWSVPAGGQRRADYVMERSSLALQWLGRLSRGEPLAVPEGVTQSPTSAWSYAHRICDLLEGRVTGVVHTAGPESMPRIDYVRRLAHAFGLNASLVHSIPFGEPPIPMPANTSLCDDRIRSLAQPLCDATQGLAVLRRQLEEVGVSL